jgi:hypothetical protein
VCAPRPRRKSICKPKGRQIFTKSTGTKGQVSHALNVRQHANQRVATHCKHRNRAVKSLSSTREQRSHKILLTATREPKSSHRLLCCPRPREPKSSPLFHFLFFQIITTFYTSIISIGRNTLNFLIWFDQKF